MRGTVHLVTARDCLAFRAMVAESLRKRVAGVLRARLEGVGLDEIARLAAPMIEAEPLQSPEVGRRLARGASARGDVRGAGLGDGRRGARRAAPAARAVGGATARRC